MAVIATFAVLVSGALANGAPGDVPQIFRNVHVLISGLAVGLALVQCFAVWSGPPARRNWSFAALILMLLDGAGGFALPSDAQNAASVLHACLAPLAFAPLAMAVADTGAGWTTLAPIPGGLTKAARTVAPLAVLQIILGALYRHKIWGVLPHMGGALAVTLVALLVSTGILQRSAEKSPLKTAASGLLAAVLAQVTLGIAAFVMRLLDQDDTMLFRGAASLHVATSGLVLASAGILARGVQKMAVGASQ